ncbi:ankyrin repeat-containing domain protein [Halteromyces radiatus]|uniref:ankyrin repeat-containing domain protein n=1 Tax=Halteromyces radiatus TaxID=101107 RepID=UPI00221E41F1|nr:ankyrin repeat-containing domain protein [Halteromyces radiatus]KAI8099807.1 ankyrin repeat-containing domain protein [Halteromyces radiatus]
MPTIHYENSAPKTSFFDLQRAAIVRESPSLRLRKAAIEGNIAAVKRLIKMVPNIQNPDPDNGYTTLMYAAKYGHLDIVHLLLEMGHEEEVISMDHKGITVLMLAIMHDHDEIYYAYVSRYRECIHAISKDGSSALLIAAQKGNANLVRNLLSISVDIDHTDNEGNSAFHYACAWGHPAVMELLMSENCNVELENNDHFTAADVAYSFGIKDHLKELSEMTIINGDSATSLSSSYKQSLLNSRIYPPPLSNNGAYSSVNTSTMISRGPSYGGTMDSPTPRASTSSSSTILPSVGIPIINSASTGAHYRSNETYLEQQHERVPSADSKSFKGRF